MKRAESFDPFSVPKVTDLFREVDLFSSTAEGEAQQENGSAGAGLPARKINDWEKTSLKPYVEMFDVFVKGLLKSEMTRVKRERDEEGVTGTDGMEF